MAWWKKLADKRPSDPLIACPCGGTLFYELPVRELFQGKGWVLAMSALYDLPRGRVIGATVKEFECVQCQTRYSRSELGRIEE